MVDKTYSDADIWGSDPGPDVSSAVDQVLSDEDVWGAATPDAPQKDQSRFPYALTKDESLGADKSSAMQDLKAGWQNLKQAFAGNQFTGFDSLAKMRRRLKDSAESNPYLSAEQKALIASVQDKEAQFNEAQQLQAAQDIGTASAKAAQYPEAPAATKFNNAKTFGEAWDAFTEDPYSVTRSTTLRSAAVSIPSVVGGIIGSAAGPAGASALAGAGSGWAEFGSDIADGLQQNGANLNDPQSIMAVWNKFGADIAQKARVKAGIVGGVDALTAGVGSKIAEAPGMGHIKKEVLGIANQMVGGASGEAAGEVATGQPLQPGAILGEGLGELGSGAVEQAGQIAMQGIKQTVAPGKQSQPAAPPPSAPAPTTAQPASNAPPVGTAPRAGTLTDRDVFGTKAEDAPAHMAVNTQPTEGQAKAGNYAKGHVRVQGLDITIENPRGTERTSKDPANPWSVTMPAHYGYIKRTSGADGDQVDVFLGPKAETGNKVFVVDQLDHKTGAFDEHKAIMGAETPDEAARLYHDSFSDGKGVDRIGAIHEMSVPEFKDWAKNGDTTAPLWTTREAPRPGQAPKAGRVLPPARAAKVDQAGKPIKVIEGQAQEVAPVKAIAAQPASKSGKQPEIMHAAMPAQREPISRNDMHTDEAITASGRKVPVRYAVVEASDLIASQNDEGGANPNYPAEMQPRDRERGTSQQQIHDIASKLEPRLLDQSAKASDGAPIIAPDGVVESGNGRTLALRKAYAKGMPTAAAYKQYLADRGYPVGDLKQPVLVRVRQGDMTADDRQAFTREANERDTLEMSAPERAMADAKSMTDNLLALYRGGDIAAAGNRDFVRAFIRDVVSKNDQGGMITSDGSMSQGAIRRLEAALLAKAYGDQDLVATLTEAQDNNIKSIGGALMDVAPVWAQMRAEAKAGEIAEDTDQTEHLLTAVRLVERARLTGQPLSMLVGQNDIFSGANIPYRAEAFLSLMFDNTTAWKVPIGRDRLADALRFYAEEARKTSPGVDLLGEPAAKPEEILALAKKKQQKGPSNDQEQQGLDLRPAPRKDAGKAGGTDEAQAKPRNEAPAGPEAAPKGNSQQGVKPSPHISDLVTEALRAAGWKVNKQADATFFNKTFANAAAAGTVSDGTRTISLDVDASGRWLTRHDGFKEIQVDLRDFSDDPKGAIEKVMAGAMPEKRAQSFTIRNKETGEVQMETADQSAIAKINTAKYEAVPTEQHLGELNQAIKEAGGKQPAADWFQKMKAGQAKIEPKNPSIKTEKQPAADIKKAAYGAKNTFVTKDRAEQIRAKLKEKLSGTQLNTGIDPEMVAMGTELAAYHIEAGARKFADFARAVTADLGVAIDQVKLYLRGWYNGARDMMEDAGLDVSDMDSPEQVKASLKELTNAPGSSNLLEPDRGAAAASDEVGAADVPAAAGLDGQGDGTRGTAAQPGNVRSGAGIGVSESSAPVVGAEGDLELPARQPEPPVGPAAFGDGERGGNGGQPGLPLDNLTEGQAAENARKAADLSARREAQRRAESLAVHLSDAEDIAATLPMLTPEQQGDVLKAEQRFAKPDGHGMLFTNGTGTGKTYTGLGIVKRFAKRGKTNILIIAPSQGILMDWQRSAKDLLLDINLLESTTDNGKDGIVATTYANLGQNRHLVDRNWDLVVTDEAHKLSSDKDGTRTSALETFRAITMHPEGLHTRAYHLLRDEADAVDALKAKFTALQANEKRDRVAESVAEKAWTMAANELLQKVQAMVRNWQVEPRQSKALMLSATPFAYHFSLDYAEGYLYQIDRETQGQGYNSGDGRDRFYMENLGYRMRYNKLTKPEPGVNLEIMERQLHENLKRDGSIAGRALEVEKDYDRKFVLVDDAVGHKIDEAMDILWTGDDGKYRPLWDIIKESFDYLARMRLLEAIKARHVIPIIRKDMALGRKVVVFHDYNVGGGMSPFRLILTGEETASVYQNGQAVTVNLKQLYDEFIGNNPWVETLDFSGYAAPIAALTKAFPDQALVYNGTVPTKKRDEAKKLFNIDGSGKDIIIVQSAAGEAGISLHDTTGKQPRVLRNLGMPVRPTTSLQQEGRIYRVGQASDAMFRYMNTGTNWERWTFAGKIAERAGTAENLAMGEQARTIRLSFINAFNEADSEEPSPDDGKGGKALDRATNTTISDWDRAKTHYFAQQKNTKRRDQREGNDYYATPEPIGLKMVELAKIKTGEKVLEPSAGHGAIARYFPEGAARTLVEPSNFLASRAALNAVGSRVVNTSFENFDIVNKFDAIIMNPPYGVGGKTAIEHVAKALRHLKNGGRIVALIPTGPSADRRYEDFMASDAAVSLYEVASIELPQVTFERAGTGVMTVIKVLEKQTDATVRDRLQSKRANYTGAETINELFDRIEGLDIADRLEPVTKDEEQPATASSAPASQGIAGDTTFTSAETKHGKTGEDLFIATADQRVDSDTFKAFSAAAKNHGGWYSSFRGLGAIPGFQFRSADARQAFLNEVSGKPAVMGNIEDQTKAEAAASPLRRLLMAAAQGFGYKIVDTGLPFGYTDHWGKTWSFGTQIIDKAIPGDEIGRWIDKVGNAGPEMGRYIKHHMTAPWAHRVWFGHDPLANLGTIIDKFGVSALPDWLGQLAKDSLTKAGIPLPGVQWLVQGGLVGDRFATAWLSLNVGEALSGGLSILGTYRLSKRLANGQDVHKGWAAVGVLFKLVGGSLSANPVVLLSAAADTVLLAKATARDIRATLQKGQERSRGAGGPSIMGNVTDVAPPFYSALARSVEALKMNRANAEQWSATIRNQPGIKPEEMAWLGVDDWLKAQDGPVTKEQLLSFLRANQVQVQEVLKGANTSATKEDSERLRAALLAMDDVNATLASALVQGAERGEEISIGDMEEMGVPDDVLAPFRDGGGGPTKFPEYQIPGGENYRELLLTLPDDRPHGRIGRFVLTRNGGPMTKPYATMEEAERQLDSIPDHIRSQVKIVEVEGDQPAFEPPKFSSSHWDEPNILAHVRFNERVIDAPYTEEDWKILGIRSELYPEYQRLTDEITSLQKRAVSEGNTKSEAKRVEALERAKRGEITLGEANRIMNTWGNDGPDTPTQTRLKEVHAEREALKMPPEPKRNKQRILFIEEVQSDWHQIGRKKGYSTRTKAYDPSRLTIDDLRPVKEANGMLWLLADGRGDEYDEQRYTSEQDAIAEINRQNSHKTGIPDAPFKTTWPELAMKRMIRWAAENGFDSVAWTPGDVQAERYNLSKQIDRIGYTARKDGLFNFTAEKSGQKILQEDGITADRIAEIAGKEIAEKIQNGEGKVYDTYQGNKTAELSGLDLKVGGSGMRGFYDKMLVDVANKLGKKWGAKVGRMNINSGGGKPTAYADFAAYQKAQAEPLAAHALPITEAMRDSVMRGQPLFNQSGKQSETQLAATKAQIDAVADRVEALTQKLLGRRINIVTGDAASLGLPPEYTAAYDNRDRTIYVTMKAAASIANNVAHESLHAMRDLGLISQQEWTALVAMARKNGFAPSATSVATYRREYMGRWRMTEAQFADKMDEEAVARLFGDYVSVRDRVTPWVRKVVDKLLEWADAVLQVMGAAGIDVQARQFMRQAERGDVGRRGWAPPEMDMGTQQGNAPADEPPTLTEPGADGKPQLVLPGAEPVPVKSQVQRRADAPMKPAKAQNEMDIGLFGDEQKQLGLFGNITETPAFKRWFGQSAVVDAGGKPLVVYHGAPDARFVRDHGVFQTALQRYNGSQKGGAFWFAKDRTTAASYADDRRAFDYQDAEPGVVEVFLKMENPLIVDGNGKPWREAQARGKTSDVIEEAQAGGHDGVIIRNVKDDYTGFGNGNPNRATDTYVVFSPSQIKSATGNSGAFDPSNPSILGNAPDDGSRHPTLGSHLSDPSEAASTEEDRQRLKDLAGNINLHRINTTEDIKAMLRQVAEDAGDFIAERRGVVSNEQTAALAEELGMSVKDLLARENGMAFNAHQIYAARVMMLKSAERVKRRARVAQASNKLTDLAEFQKAVTRHRAIQEQVAGMTAEAGRALQQFNMLAGKDYLRGMDAVLKSVRNPKAGFATKAKGEEEMARDLAQMITDLDDPSKIGRFIADISKATVWDMIREAWINGILSGPRTHITNILSNSLVALWQTPETYLAAQVGRLHDGDRVEIGEASARLFGLVEGAKEGWQTAKHLLRTGEHPDVESKLEAHHKQAIPGKLGTIVRVPGALLEAEDQIFKAVNYRAEINAQALRQALKEGRTGAGLTARIAELRANPSRAMRDAAHNHALYQTFQNQLGKKGKLVNNLREAIPGAWLILPFIRTPANIIKYAAERTPFGLLMRPVRDTLSGKNGSVARDMQIARMAIGTTLMTTVVALTMAGMISGGPPDDRDEEAAMRATGWQPYSMKVGDTWYSYERLDPIAMILGIGADMVQLGDALTESEYNRMASIVVNAVADNIRNKTYLSGLVTAFDAFFSGEVGKLESWGRRLGSSVVPQFVAQGAQAWDPVVRQQRSLLDAIKARVPGWSTTLSPSRNVFGEVLTRQGAIGPDAISPLFMSREKDNPVAREMLRVSYFPSMPSRVVAGHQLTALQYDRYVELSGTAATDRLRREIGSGAWARMPDEKQKDAIKDAFEQSRRQARTLLQREWPELRASK